MRQSRIVAWRREFEVVMSLLDAAHRCLVEADVQRKLSHIAQLEESLENRELPGAGADVTANPVDTPGRPDRPRRVPPRQLAQRGLGTPEGRAAFVHAIAHIEFNAINLACDAVYRFRGMPAAFYRDWAGVAVDEARHFALLRERLLQLGHDYGDFDAHDGLWEMAAKTAHSCRERMALVPRVLEARGLDVTPGMIVRLRGVGDESTAQILEVILREEVAHVAIGSRWFVWCCERDGVDSGPEFARLIALHAHGALRGPFNQDARRAAGFTPADLELLESLQPARN